MPRASDRDLLKKAKEMSRILVMRDKGFGALVFLEKTLSSGVILLRGSSTEIDKTHNELERVHPNHSLREI